MNTPWRIFLQLLTHPTRVAVVDDQRSWRGIDLVVGALHVATHLERAGQSPHVGLLLPTGGLFPMAALAGWMLGRTVVPLNYLLKDEDLQYVVDDSEIDTIVTVGPMLDFIGGAPRGPGLLRLDHLDFKALPEFRWPRWPSPDDLAVLLYTSGTSGKPKGVMLTHRNLYSNIQQCASWAQFDDRDTIVGVLPQFHVFGLTALTMLPLCVGVRSVFTARFVPRKIVQLIREHRATAFMGIASMFNALLTVKDAKAEDWRQVRYLVSGGEPLPDAVAQGFKDRFGVIINEGYGMTETSAVTHWCRPQDYRRGSVGRGITGVSTRIVDLNTGEDCPPHVDGEIRVAGSNIMKGYYKLPEETAAAFDERGYLRTGDIGHLDEDDFLFITGRLKEMMIIGGENVFPREIEEALNKHESVTASGVIGVSDPSRGEVPVAFVEMKEDATFDETALRAHCRRYLAQYKVPRDILPAEKLPRTPTGKILRRELRNMLPVEAAA